MIRLERTLPSDMVEYGRDFTIQGRIITDEPLPDNTSLRMELFRNKQLLRYVHSERKNDDRLYLAHPDLIHYAAELDPDFSKLKAFGYPELLVEDIDDPLSSFHNAEIKCFFNDECFKAIIVSGSDIAHGRIFDSGVGFLSAEGEPYQTLEEGTYDLKISLYLEDELLAEDISEVLIFHRTDQAIVRFNPQSHKQRMILWCKENHFSVIEDLLPGYLEPYLGKWYYHMGLLKYYRSNDIVLYRNSRVHMFVYLISADSTSYASEYAYLQSQGLIDDQERFFAYHYDQGEAILHKGPLKEKKAKIIQFEDVLDFYRADLVDDKAEENRFHIDERNISDIFYDVEDIEVKAPCRLAISGVIRPTQFDREDFILQDDNTYEIHNRYEKIAYHLTDQNEESESIRPVILERYADETIGESLFEFYHIFEFTKEDKGRDIRIGVELIDAYGKRKKVKKSPHIRVL